MNGHDYTVEFRIQSRSLRMSDITLELGLAPVRCQEKGDKHLGKPLEKGIWIFDGAVGAGRWGSLEAGLTFVLDKLWGHREVIGKYKRVADILWWCGSFQSSIDGGPTFSPELMGRLGEFGAILYLETYFSLLNEEDQS